MVEEDARLLKREELVSIAPEDAGEVEREDPAKVERPHACLVELRLVALLDPACLVALEELLATLEADAGRRQVLGFFKRKDKALLESALRNRDLVHEDPVAAVVHRGIERQVYAGERNAEVMVEGTPDGHDLVVQRLVGKRTADICVYVDGEGRHHREVVAVLLLGARRRPLGRRSGGKRIFGLRRARGGDLGLRVEAPADKRDERREAEDLNLREAGDEPDRDKHHRAEHD